MYRHVLLVHAESVCCVQLKAVDLHCQCVPLLGGTHRWKFFFLFWCPVSFCGCCMCVLSRWFLQCTRMRVICGNLSSSAQSFIQKQSLCTVLGLIPESFHTVSRFPSRVHVSIFFFVPVSHFKIHPLSFIFGRQTLFLSFGSSSYHTPNQALHVQCLSCVLMHRPTFRPTV